MLYLVISHGDTGIFPTNRNVISSLATKPSEIFVSANNDKADETEPANDITDLSVPEDFFESKVDKIKKRKSEKKVKPRQCVSCYMRWTRFLRTQFISSFFVFLLFFVVFFDCSTLDLFPCPLPLVDLLSLFTDLFIFSAS
jgi:hypothetical protein